MVRNNKYHIFSVEILNLRKIICESNSTNIIEIRATYDNMSMVKRMILSSENKERDINIYPKNMIQVDYYELEKYLTTLICDQCDMIGFIYDAFDNGFGDYYGNYYFCSCFHGQEKEKIAKKLNMLADELYQFLTNKFS